MKRRSSPSYAATVTVIVTVAVALATLGIGTLALAPPTLALHQPQATPLHERTLAPAGFNATVAPQEIGEIEKDLDGAVRAEVSAFRLEAGGSWRFIIDRRSGGMAMVEGSGT